MSRLLAVIALSFTAAAGCGGEGENNTSPAGLTVEQVAAKTLDIRCENGVECRIYESDAECRATSRADAAQYQASIKAGRIVYHPEKAQACLDALAAVLGCTVTDSFGAAATAAEDACAEAFEPTVADGGACYSSTECISRVCDVAACGMACCEGKCAANSQVKIGDSCMNNESCVDGAYCKPDDMGDPTTCVAQVEVGKPCDAFDGCKLPAFCAFDFAATTSACVVPAAHGATCDTNAIFPCDRLDDFCDETTKKCVEVNQIGEACADTTFCAFDAKCTGGKCEKKPAVGGKCDPMGFGQCLGDLQCDVEGSCQFGEEMACP